MKKITLITQFFPPDYAATGQLLECLTNRLSCSKLKFRIICGMPYYAYKKSKVSKYEFQKNRYILRMRLSTFLKKNIFGRTFNSFLFFLNCIYSLLFIFPNSDLTIFTTEPPFLPFISLFTFYLKKNKYILINYDSYPNILYENNYISKKNLIINFWLFLNRIIYTNAEKIVMLSSSMAEKFIEDYPYTKNKITVIPSWADVNKIKPLSKGNNWFIRKYGLQDKFVVLYSGNQGRCHDFQTILDASLLLKKNNKIVFLFIGNGYQNQLIREFKISHDLHNIKLLDYQPFENLPFSLPSADLALVSIAQNAGTLIAPSKFYGHLAAGTPIALISPKNSYLENLVNSNNLGSSFLNGESNKLKEWILLMEQKDELKLTYSKNSREFIMQNYSEEIISKKYYDLINSVINID